MSEDEVEIEASDEEYEVIPLSPIRKLEKRIDELETKKSKMESKSFVNEMMELIKANQRMVERMVESNSQLRAELERLPGKIDQVTDQWKEFLELLKKGGGIDSSEERSPEVQELLELNKSLIQKNEDIVESLKSLENNMQKGEEPEPVASDQRRERKDRRSPSIRIKKKSSERDRRSRADENRL